MMRSWAYNRFGVLMGTSWRASCPRWLNLRRGSLPMIALFLSQGDFYATALFLWLVVYVCQQSLLQTIDQQRVVSWKAHPSGPSALGNPLCYRSLALLDRSHPVFASNGVATRDSVIQTPVGRSTALQESCQGP